MRSATSARGSESASRSDPVDATVHPYGEIVKVAAGVWCIEGEWRRSPFARRMTLLDLGGGTLAVHSAIRLREEDRPKIDALGTVALVIAPNAMHSAEVPWYAERWPRARVLVPRAAVERLKPTYPRIDGTLEDDWPAELGPTLKREPLGGLPKLHPMREAFAELARG